MDHGPVFCFPGNDATTAAGHFLSSIGIPVVYELPNECEHILLPVPSFRQQSEALCDILSSATHSAVISGGSLPSSLLERFRCIDFLKDPRYLADNAAITARCAVKIIHRNLGDSYAGMRTIILGFGRIGKCLCLELSRFRCELYVAARKKSDLAAIHSLGLHPIHFEDVPFAAENAALIINTVPKMVLHDFEPPANCLALELASVPGLEGSNVVSALGLPGKMAPDESGELIARTFIRLSL